MVLRGWTRWFDFALRRSMKAAQPKAPLQIRVIKWARSRRPRPLAQSVSVPADDKLKCQRLFLAPYAALVVRKDRALAAAAQGFATATDLADYLVMRGVPFRDAHAVVGRCVRRATDAGCDLADLPLTDLQAESDVIADDVYAVLTVEGSVAARDHIGGTAPNQVRAAIARARSDV